MSILDLTSETVLLVPVALASSAIALAFLMQIFSERPATQDDDSPASHFKLNELMARRTVRWLSLLCALPFAGMYLMLSLKSSTLVEAVRGYLSVQLVGVLDPKFKGEVLDLLSAVPSWLSPLFVVLMALIMFAPRIRAPFVLFRSLVFTVLAIDERVNDEARKAASTVLDRMNRKDAERALVRAAGTRAAPLPVRMAKAPERERLTFQLLCFSKATIQQGGTRAGLAATLKKIGVELPASEARPAIASGHLFAALTFYGILCAAYIIFMPLVAPWVQKSEFVRAILQQIVWPEDRDILALSVVQRTLSFIVPLATGMYLFNARQLQHRAESLFQAYIFILSLQFLFSLFVNLGFAVVSVAQRTTGELQGNSLSFSDVRLWTDAFVYSLTPGAALLSWIYCGRLGVRGIAAIVHVCLAAAIAFGACQFAYELMSTSIGYYWHQLVLGAFITLSYGLAAFVARDIFPPIDTIGESAQPPPEPITVAETGGAD